MFKQLLFEIVENILFITTHNNVPEKRLYMYETNERKRKKNLVKCWSLIFIIAFGKKGKKKFSTSLYCSFRYNKRKEKEEKKTNNK